MADDRRAAKVLLIGWDAADWKFINPLLDAGRMPNLSRLVDDGVIGNIATLKPCLSPILWTSIATGKTADKHGIAGFVEPIPDGSGVRLSSSTSRTTKALWNILSQNDITTAVVNWYASHPAEPIRGTCVSNRFFESPPADPNLPWEVVPGSVQPESLLPVVAQFRMHPAELGRADIARFIPDIDRIDLTTDRRPAQLADAIARTVSVHSVATGIMEAEPWDFLAVYYDGLDVAGHQFMPYHPPQMPGVSDRDFATYQHVMRELYLFHDAMLGRLLDLAGPDTTVILVSDHGFHCDHLRPTQSAETEEAQAALWHRQYGIFAMRGPGVRHDERVYGANLLDITPTVLTLFGLPVGLDMDGRPLLQAFEDPPRHLSTIPSWDAAPGEAGTHPAELLQPASESQAAIEQLIALGYLPAASAEARQAVIIAVAESKFNLAVVHSAHGREKKAVSLLEGLHAEFPEQPRYALALAKSHANLGQHAQSRAIIEKLEARGWQSPETDLLTAAALFHEGKADQALARLAECERKYPPAVAIYTMIGNMCAARKNWHEAAEAFEKALALDGDDPHSHNGLAQALLRLCRYEPAAEHALRAVGLLFFYPMAHFHLGMAFLGMGEPARAVRSLELAVSQSPDFHEARHQLELLKKGSGKISGSEDRPRRHEGTK